jgi:hypothetical protein
MKKRGKQNPVRFDAKEMKTDMGKGNFIFIGSSCDMFHWDLCSIWVSNTLNKANLYDNQYLVQSKNPGRFSIFSEELLPEKYTLCTTIETNRVYPGIMGNSPPTEDRSAAMSKLPNTYKRMVTVEPIMDFDIKAMTYMILACKPDQVNIGADSGNNGLPEPTTKKVMDLIDVLSRNTKVFQKPNIARLLKE